MWVFISTEVMLFAGLFASYFVVRFATIEEGWPTPTLLHVSPLIGVLNTIILVLSGIAVWNSAKSAQSDRPATAKVWLLITVFLGTAFLAIKGYEYYGKYRVGLIPTAQRQQIYHTTSYQYLSAVDRRLGEQIDEIEKSRDTNPSSNTSETRSKLDNLYDLRKYFASWTIETVGKLNNAYHEQIAIRQMAFLIYNHPDSYRGIETFTTDERDHLELSQQKLGERIALANQRVELIKKQIADLNQEIEQIKILNTNAATNPPESLKKKTRWLAVKETQSEKLNEEINLLDAEFNRAAGRLKWVRDIVQMEDGLNFGMDLRLPVVVTNGLQWMSMYLLFTGIHALHVIGGLLAFLWFLPRRLEGQTASRLFIAGMYWQFVDFAWISIFLLFYF